MASPKQTYTIEDFIIEGKAVTITYDNLAYIERISNGSYMPIFNVLDDYMAELNSITVTVELTDDELIRYAYKPKLLANDIYGNPELFFVILLINGICDVKEFNMKKIKMISQDNMNLALTLIYNAEKKMIDRYNNN